MVTIINCINPTIPQSRRYLRGVGISAMIKNIVSTDITNIKWSIDINGAVFLGNHTEGVISCIPSGELKTIQSQLVFGIGPATVNVTADESTKIANCFLFGPFVLGLT